MNIKKNVAEAAVEFIKNGMIVGLGTGSTAYWATLKLGEKIKQGLEIKAIATSAKTEELARKLHIPLVTFSEIDHIDTTIDGADEVDPALNLIKGGGGALLREKIVAQASRELIIVVDETKMVNQLGRFPLPVEVISFGLEMTKRNIELLGCRTQIRTSEGGSIFLTDNGNSILDCHFGQIKNPDITNRELNMIPGVIDNGLFVRMATRILVGFEDGSIERVNRA